MKISRNQYKSLKKITLFHLLALCLYPSLGLSTTGLSSHDELNPQDHRTPPPQEYYQRQIISCYSNSPAPYYCQLAGEIVEIHFLRQLSYYQCIPNQTFGYSTNYVWVSHGCAAEFDILTRHYRHNPDDGGRPPRRPRHEIEYINCESNHHRYRECLVSSRGEIIDVSIDEQYSSTHCREGQNWGFTTDRIWVDEGCGARFRVETEF